MVDAFAHPKLTLEPGSSRHSSLTSGYGFHNPLGAMCLQMYRHRPPARSTYSAADTADG